MSTADPTTGGCPVAHDTFDPFEHFDLSYFAQARDESPVFFHEGLGGYFLTRYDDCVAVLGDRGTHVSASPALLSHLNVAPSPQAMEILGASEFKIAPSIVDEDGEEHKKHRSVAQPPFSPKRVQELEPFIRKLISDQLDAIVARGHADIVDEAIYDVPGAVILHMMGVPDEQLGMVKGFRGPWAEFIWGLPSDEMQVHVAEGMAQFGEWAHGIAERSLADDSSEDIISEAIRNLRERGIDIEGTEPERAWLDSYTLNVVMAGHETTVNSCAGGIVALLADRAQWEAIVADPELIPNAADEILRYCTGVPAWRQRVIKEMQLPSGTTLPEGALVYAAINSANRDESVFSDGESFDVRRENARRHVTFGKGAHTCMGNHLAKLEITVILQELARRLPHMRLVDGQTFTTSPNTSQRGPEQIHVEWDPAENPVAEDRAR